MKPPSCRFGLLGRAMSTVKGITAGENYVANTHGSFEPALHQDHFHFYKCVSETAVR
jgi:hypothetical protein